MYYLDPSTQGNCVTMATNLSPDLDQRTVAVTLHTYWRHFAWYGVVWYGVVWCGLVWSGLVWRGLVWCGKCRCIVTKASNVYHLLSCTACCHCRCILLIVMWESLLTISGRTATVCSGVTDELTTSTQMFIEKSTDYSLSSHQLLTGKLLHNWHWMLIKSTLSTVT